MRILVVGCGSIGRRHIRLLREMGVEVYGYDTNPESLFALKDIPGVMVNPPVASLHDFLRHGFDGVIVATPPDKHRTPALYAMDLGVRYVLVEKPIAQDIYAASSILFLAKDTDSTVCVGYNLRFHPGLRKVKELLDNGAVGSPLCASIYCGSYLPDWRPGTDYRSNYAARRDSGGGVLLDISHEIDMALWLFGEPAAVTCMAQTTGALEGLQTEDVADVLIRFKSGVQVNVHLDYVRRDRKRGCEIVGTEGTLVWDAASEFVYRCDGEPLNKYQWFVGPVDGDTMYRAQLRHFLAVIRGKETPVCTGEDGLLALRLALAARESAETGKVVTL